MSKLEELERRFKAHKQVRAGAYNWQNFAEVLLAALRESEADRQLERDQTEMEQADNARLHAVVKALDQLVYSYVDPTDIYSEDNKTVQESLDRTGQVIALEDK